MKRTSAFIRNVIAILIGMSFVVFCVNSEAQIKKSEKRRLFFEWEEVEGAKLYQVELTKLIGKDKKKKPVIFKRKKPTFDAKVSPGKYLIRMRSFDSRSVPGDWSETFDVVVKVLPPKKIYPTKALKIKSKDSEEEDVVFKWSKVGGAKDYRLEIVDSKSGNSVFNEVVDELEKEVELPVAASYDWRVTAIYKDGTEGEMGELGTPFVLLGEKLDKPDIEKPDTDFVRELKWSKPDRAGYYSYHLFKLNKKRKKWELIEKGPVEKSNEIAFNEKYSGGKYRLKVKAHADNVISSDLAKMEFKVYDGDRSPAAAYRHEMRESMEKEANAYFVASYLLSSVEYTSVIKELDKSSSTDVVGGTGRLGLGYFFEDSSWGTLLIADLSGVVIGGKNYTYSAAELHGSWRTYWGISQVRISGGLFYKELPATIPSDVDEVEVENVNLYGPHLGFDIWYPLSRSFGIQFNTRFYVGLDGEAPNDESIVPSLSYQAGVLGSLRLSQNVMGFLGYAYRLDSATFDARAGSNSPDSDSFAEDGDQDEVSIEGHYLNLFLEWGF